MDDIAPALPCRSSSSGTLCSSCNSSSTFAWLITLAVSSSKPLTLTATSIMVPRLLFMAATLLMLAALSHAIVQSGELRLQGTSSSIVFGSDQPGNGSLALRLTPSALHVNGLSVNGLSLMSLLIAQPLTINVGSQRAVTNLQAALDSLAGKLILAQVDIMLDAEMFVSNTDITVQHLNSPELISIIGSPNTTITFPLQNQFILKGPGASISMRGFSILGNNSNQYAYCLSILQGAVVFVDDVSVSGCLYGVAVMKGSTAFLTNMNITTLSNPNAVALASSSTSYVALSGSTMTCSNGTAQPGSMGVYTSVYGAIELTSPANIVNNCETGAWCQTVHGQISGYSLSTLLTVNGAVTPVFGCTDG